MFVKVKVCAALVWPTVVLAKVSVVEEGDTERTGSFGLVVELEVEPPLPQPAIKRETDKEARAKRKRGIQESDPMSFDGKDDYRDFWWHVHEVLWGANKLISEAD